MRISIAIPSYNYAQFLEACLVSVQEQNYLDFEVLIADGGSNDGSMEIIQRFCAEDKRFSLVSTSDNGQADAIKKAFQHVTGDVLCFLNADDCYICKDALSAVAEAFDEHSGASLISFGGYYLDVEGHWLRPVQYRYHPFDGFHLMRYRTAVLQPATFWRKHVYNESEWPDRYHFVFDVVFFYAAYQKYSWLELGKPVAGYRLHGDNKSVSVKSARIKELADFEEIKFGAGSWRATYLRAISSTVKFFEQHRGFGRVASRMIYLIANSLAFISCYRLPGI